MLEFDHIAVTCDRLEDGTAWAEERLGLPLGAGGQHPDFGTHNRLLSLGPDAYLEVIAIDPAAPPPPRARWFGLDDRSGPPGLSHWIVRCTDLDGALAAAPAGAGRPMALSRGAYRWRMAVPEDGHLPMGARFPALIAWDGPHPAAALPDVGARLSRLEVSHPQADSIAAGLPGLADPRVRIVQGAPGLRAVIHTPAGERVL